MKYNFQISSGIIASKINVLKNLAGRVDGWMDGWMDGWKEGWKEGKAGLRIAYSNQK